MITLKGVGMLPTRHLVVMNRTGATLTVGGAYALDTSWTYTADAVAANNSTDADTGLTNLVGVLTANLRGFAVIAENAALAGAQCTVLVTGMVSALVDGTTNVAAGDALVAQNGSINLVKQGASVTTPSCALALAAQTGTVGTLTNIFFDGWEMWRQQNGSANTALATVADSATITGTDTGEQTSDGLAASTFITIPANTLKAGDTIDLWAQVVETNATGGNVSAKLKFGTGATIAAAIGGAAGTAVAALPATAANNGDVGIMHMRLTVRVAGAAATGKIVGVGTITLLGPAGTPTSRAAVLAETAFDTTVAELFGVAILLSTANGQTALLRSLSATITHA